MKLHLLLPRHRWPPVWCVGLLVAAIGGSLQPGRVVAQVLSGGSLIIRLGNDTLAVERFSRTTTRMEGEILRRVPSTAHWRYGMILDPRGLPRVFQLTLVQAARPEQLRGLRAVRITFERDSAFVEMVRDSITRRALPAPNGVPGFPEFSGFVELWDASLRAGRRDSGTVTIIAPLGGPNGALSLRRSGTDTVTASIFGLPLVVTTDATGHIQRIDGTGTTIKLIATRGDPLDLAPLYATFAARDKAGQGVGASASPRDTVETDLGRAHFWLEYGRPSLRGREVFARGVLGDTLWRTGANAATQLRTGADLEFDGHTLPAGFYSLWTHIDGGAAELIFNGETGQWGTRYDRSRDVLRVPLLLTPAAGGPRVEQFTIDVTALGGDRGAIRLRWGNREYQARFSVR